MKAIRGKGRAAEEERSLFAIVPILLNAVAIAILIGVYCYVISKELFPDYQNYIYWTINVLVSYNILAASARSIIAPILSIIVGALGIFAKSSTSFAIFGALTSAQCWQFAVLGIIGILITFSLRL